MISSGEMASRFQEIYAGGRYGFSGGEGLPGQDLPCFYFDTNDLDEAMRCLGGMYVELSVRFDDQGRLAYCLDVPDRDVKPWSIPLLEKDLRALDRGNRVGRLCPTYVRAADGQAIDLRHFAREIEHDWSGHVAQGVAAFAAGDLAEATALFAKVAADNPRRIPDAHHLLGLCHRARGDLQQALACYRSAVHVASDPESGKLLPFASGPLSDMGVAYKKLGAIDKAVHCFLYSLQLRPNHPEALLSFFSLFAPDGEYILFAVARVLALGRTELAEGFLSDYARNSGAPLMELLLKARALSRRVDLTNWPLSNERFTHLDLFEKGLHEPPPAEPIRQQLAVVRSSKKWNLG